MNYTKTIETERLILRKFNIDDAEGMYKNWAIDPKVNKFLSWPLHESIEVTRGVIENWISKYNNGSYNWIVEEKATHTVI